MRFTYLAQAALGISLSASALAQQPAAASPPVDETLAPYANRADSVRLSDGREFHFVCMGEGSPTVILTAGLGDWASTWNTVQPAIARTTRACAWDRPGWGLSDGAAGGATVASNTADLAAALERGGIGGPYVLVGHSLGSYESLLFADGHPDAVVGMVLVDPSVPDQFSLMQRVAPAVVADSGAGQQRFAGVLRKCAADFRSGKLKAGGPDPDGCVSFPRFFPPALREALAEKVANPLQYETMASFFDGVPAAGAIVANPARDYGEMPMIVLSATELGQLPPEMSDDTKAQMAIFQGEFGRAHLELAALSTRGVNARVPGADHYVQRAKPQVVIDAVEAVVAEARAAND